MLTYTLYLTSGRHVRCQVPQFVPPNYNGYTNGQYYGGYGPSQYPPAPYVSWAMV